MSIAYWIAYWIAFRIADWVAGSAAGSWAGPGPGPIVGRTGSWAGPAWLEMLLGLAGNQGGGGGGKGYFMYLKYNFSLDTAKRMLKPFVHTSFSIRVFWLR